MIERKFPKEWSEYKEVVDRLKLMLDKPEEGLMSWNYMTMALLDQLSTMWNGAPVKDLVKDAFKEGFSKGADEPANHSGYWRWEPVAEREFERWQESQNRMSSTDAAKLLGRDIKKDLEAIRKDMDERPRPYGSALDDTELP